MPVIQGEVTQADEVVIHITGEPAPGGSKKHIGGGRIVEASKHAPKWRRIVAQHAKLAMRRRAIFTGPLSITVLFKLTRPKSHYRTGKFSTQLKPDAPKFILKAPDSTKLMRSTEDAMTGIVYTDDAIIVDQHISKKWACRYTEKPGAKIIITPLA